VIKFSKVTTNPVTHVSSGLLGQASVTEGCPPAASSASIPEGRAGTLNPEEASVKKIEIILFKFC
jgi:hypothetical protein